MVAIQGHCLFIYQIAFHFVNSNLNLFEARLENEVFARVVRGSFGYHPVAGANIIAGYRVVDEAMEVHDLPAIVTGAVSVKPRMPVIANNSAFAGLCRNRARVLKRTPNIV